MLPPSLSPGERGIEALLFVRYKESVTIVTRISKAVAPGFQRTRTPTRSSTYRPSHCSAFPRGFCWIYLPPHAIVPLHLAISTHPQSTTRLDSTRISHLHLLLKHAKRPGASIVCLLGQDRHRLDIVFKNTSRIQWLPHLHPTILTPPLRLTLTPKHEGIACATGAKLPNDQAWTSSECVADV